MIIGSKKRLSQVTADPAINVGNLEIKRVKTTKSLGLMIESLTWTAQFEHISKKVTSGLAILRRLRDTVKFNTLITTGAAEPGGGALGASAPPPPLFCTWGKSALFRE